MRDETAKKSTDTRRGGGGTGAGKPGWFAVRFGLDRANRELRVCMTRAVAGVSVAGFCGLFIGIVAVSRNASNNGPQSAHASIIEPAAEEGLPRVTPVKAPPAKPRPAQVQTAAKPLASVNVPVRHAPAPAVTLGKAKVIPPTPTMPDVGNKDSVASKAPVAAAVAPAKPEARTVGHNYLVFGSFPTMSEARRTHSRLNKDGVACTIERSLPGWTKKGWYSVVSVKGYETTTKNAAYRAEVKTLEALGLEPRAYRWRNSGV